jgi:hypothetical protein
MNTTRARLFRGPRRVTAILLAAAMGGSGMLLAGCSQGSSPSSASSAARSGFGSATAAGPAQPLGQATSRDGSARSALGQAPAGSAGSPGQAVSLTLASQDIVYTASLTVQAANVAAAASAAGSIAGAAGGYVASQRELIRPGQHTAASASLQLKIPALAYQATLGRLGKLGTVTSVSRQARDVTQQVADVGSRVTSAQDAISQLRALLRRAGSVSGLLDVQDQINFQESALEALLAQQRALSRETAYATVTLQLVSHHRKSVTAKDDKGGGGFAAGLGGGWRAFRLTVSWLLTVIGAVLPFAVIAALAGGLGYGGRRRWLRRRASQTTAA